jgi:phosphatidylglycerophosphate synthase
MLDGAIRRKIDPVLLWMGHGLASAGVTANVVTLAAWAIGLFAALLIWHQHFLAGLLFIMASRLADGLDGAVARASGTTEFGGYLDIVLDFFFYGAIPLAFILADPASNAIAGSILIFSFYFNGATFLAYSAVAERLGMKTEIRGQKSVYFTTGLAEATETILVFALSCLFPAWFPIVAYCFAAVTMWTAISRLLLAKREFRDNR